MTLILTLSPEKETRLQKQARRAGLTLSEYAGRVLAQAADADPDLDPGVDLSDWDDPHDAVKERIARFKAWAAGHDRGTPLLTEEAVSRESMYGDTDG